MRYLTTFALILALALPAAAAFSGPGARPLSEPAPNAKHGGFEGPGARGVTTAAEVKKARDDMHVVLEGRLVERLRGDKYTFRDDSGTVVVDIDDEDFHGRTVTPQTRVRIYGEVDTEWNRPSEVDVDRLEVLR